VAVRVADDHVPARVGLLGEVNQGVAGADLYRSKLGHVV
jgi:hypothetical protein